MAKSRLTLGVFAHVDAGKTTLSENILYRAGVLRSMGRVDHGTTFFDGDKLERERGITVFSKESRFEIGEKEFTIIDTPGHADFRSETERTMAVLDYAVLVISGTSGVQSHTEVLWEMLKEYGIPIFIFVNKMDLAGADKDAVLSELKEHFGNGFVDFHNVSLDADKDVEIAANDTFFEELAVSSDSLTEEYLETGKISLESIKFAIDQRDVYPVYFGSALKDMGVAEFLEGLARLTVSEIYSKDFGARVYKITRDKQGVRQTHLKITGGILKSKMLVAGNTWEEKADQIRLYSGDKYSMVQEASAGMICAVTGFSKTQAGEKIGSERDSRRRSFSALVDENIKLYEVVFPKGANIQKYLEWLSQLEEEEPSLNIRQREKTQTVYIHAPGKLALETLAYKLKERYKAEISFSQAKDLRYIEMLDERERMAELEFLEELMNSVSEEEAEKQERIKAWEEKEAASKRAVSAGDKVLEAIFKKTYGESKRDEAIRKANFSKKLKEGSTNRSGVGDINASTYVAGKASHSKKIFREEDKNAEKYLLVDGYNVIFAWDELKELSNINIDSAREALIELLKNYGGINNIKITVVFDGYRAAGNPGSRYMDGNVEVVFTKEGETADNYIEKTVFSKKKGFDITVVSSDRTVQMTVMGDGALRISSREFYDEITRAAEAIRNKLNNSDNTKNRPFEGKV